MRGVDRLGTSYIGNGLTGGFSHQVLAYVSGCLDTDSGRSMTEKDYRVNGDGDQSRISLVSPVPEDNSLGYETEGSKRSSGSNGA